MWKRAVTGFGLVDRGKEGGKPVRVDMSVRIRFTALARSSRGVPDSSELAPCRIAEAPT